MSFRKLLLVAERPRSAMGGLGPGGRSHHRGRALRPENVALRRTPRTSVAPITLKAIVATRPLRRRLPRLVGHQPQRQLRRRRGPRRRDHGRPTTPSTTSARTFTVPAVASDTSHADQRPCPQPLRQRRRLRDLPPLRLRLPAARRSPRLDRATSSTIMASTAVREGLWWMHRQMFDDPQRRLARSPPASAAATCRHDGVGMWAFTINGHLPAYPPGTIDAHGARPIPAGWAAANDRRWNNDPYAETVMRFAQRHAGDRHRLPGRSAPPTRPTPAATTRRAPRSPATASPAPATVAASTPAPTPTTRTARACSSAASPRRCRRWPAPRCRSAAAGA